MTETNNFPTESNEKQVQSADYLDGERLVIYGAWGDWNDEEEPFIIGNPVEVRR